MNLVRPRSMRKIKLSKISKLNDGYHVYLGSNHRYVFTQKRKAQKFLGDVNTFLNKQLSLLNETYSNAHKLFRDYYFVIEKNDYLRILRKNLNHIEESIDLALSRYHYENGTAFTFSHLSSVYDNLINVFTTLYGIASRRKDTPTVYQIDNVLERIDMFKERFDKLKLSYRKNHKKEEAHILKFIA